MCAPFAEGCHEHLGEGFKENGTIVILAIHRQRLAGHWVIEGTVVNSLLVDIMGGLLTYRLQERHSTS